MGDAITDNIGWTAANARLQFGQSHAKEKIAIFRSFSFINFTEIHKEGSEKATIDDVANIKPREKTSLVGL